MERRVQGSPSLVREMPFILFFYVSLLFLLVFTKGGLLLSRQQKAVRYIALQLLRVVVVVAAVVRDANVPGSVLPRVEVPR